MSCRRCNLPPRRRQEGAALVIALMVFGICAALMVAMKSDFELFYQRGANTFFTEQGYAYLRSAEDLAILALVADHDIDESRETDRDDMEEIWARSLPPSPLEDGISVMSGRFPGEQEGMFRYLEDLQGRFNLNNLQCLPPKAPAEGEGEQERFTPREAQFLRLLQSFEEPRLSLQEAIVVLDSFCDWRDSDSTPRLYGAENDYYYGRAPAYRASNRPLASVTELRAVANVTPALYQRLAPLVTVWPTGGDSTFSTLNINTALPGVLRSLNADDDLSPLPVEQVSMLLEVRDEAPFQDRDAFLAQPAFAGRTTGELKLLLGVASSWYRLGAAVKVADRTTRLYSVLHRSQRRVEVVARSSGEL